MFGLKTNKRLRLENEALRTQVALMNGETPTITEISSERYFNIRSRALTAFVQVVYDTFKMSNPKKPSRFNF